ncbi:LysR family transcriptional regulator [Xanthomonas sp. NCPPB 2632]|uniref:LysR family transcriptional regulator n=1 Tax=Xanthomonas sp. NCPPB 2632 TaxID=3240912 RepID=UPI0035120B98
MIISKYGNYDGVVGFIRQLQIFVTVAESGSFARASDTLRLARPSVTKAINELESRVGVRLLHRTTRRTSLTGEGESLYDRATTLLRDVAETQDLFGSAGFQPSGRLRVDIPVALAKPLLIPELPSFAASYPDIDLILGVSDQPVDLVADAVDCGLRIGVLPPTSMIARQLATVSMVICASPAYLARHGVPRAIDDLRSLRAVNYFSGRGNRAIAWQMSLEGHHALVMQSALMVNDAEALVACAKQGMGLIQVPELLVAEELAAGRLVKVLPGASQTLWPLSIMYPNRQYLAPQVRAFIDWMAQLVHDRRSEALRPV